MIRSRSSLTDAEFFLFYFEVYYMFIVIDVLGM